MKTRNIEKIDDLTNEIMDYIREKFHFTSESNKDDEIYSVIHSIIKDQCFIPKR